MVPSTWILYLLDLKREEMEAQTGEAYTWERFALLPHWMGGVLSIWGPAARQGPGIRHNIDFLISILPCLT